MNKNTFVLLLISLMFFTCNNNGDVAVIIDEHQPKWNKITLKTDFQSVYIFSDSDTMISNTWRYKDSLINPGEYAHIPIDRRQERIFLEAAYKDTIHSLLMEMITKPQYTDKSVTDYAGNMRACVQSANTELCCGYSSVGDWTAVSVNTKKLYNILSRKTKMSTQ
jgi:hypothetical protein